MSLEKIDEKVKAKKQRRDEFAKAALTGLMATPELTASDLGALVRDARKVADLMIAELDRTEGGE